MSFVQIPRAALGARVGPITVLRRLDGGRLMKTRGKFEGSSAPVDFQDFCALLAPLYIGSYGRAAVIGLGPGRTLGVGHAVPFEHVERVESSPATIAAARAHLERAREIGGYERFRTQTETRRRAASAPRR